MRREQRADKDYCATDAVVRNSVGRSTMNHRMKRYQYIYIYIYIFALSPSMETTSLMLLEHLWLSTERASCPRSFTCVVFATSLLSRLRCLPRAPVEWSHTSSGGFGSQVVWSYDALKRLSACLSIYVYVYSYTYIYIYIFNYIIVTVIVTLRHRAQPSKPQLNFTSQVFKFIWKLLPNSCAHACLCLISH